MDAVPENSLVQHLTKEGVQIALNAGQFDCAAGEKRALLINMSGAWKGCWTEDSDSFTIHWEDGDATVIPKAAIGKTKGHEPPAPGSV